MTAPPRPTLDILIVTWNRRDDLLRALDSIGAQSVSPARVIVVDNGSGDGTREIVPERHPHAVFLPQESNLGACGGRNMGMSRVKSDLVFFMDDDTELLPGCLEEILGRFEESPRTGAVQPAIFLSAEDAEANTDRTPRPNPHPISAAWCVRTSALPPDPWPDHFVRQGEEMWVAMHLYDRGFESEVWPGARCLHHHAAGGQREKVFFFFARNSLLLYCQRLPILLALPMAPYKALRTLFNVRSGREFRAWLAGVGGGMGMLLSGRAKRSPIGWAGAIRYLRAVRRGRMAP